MTKIVLLSAFREASYQRILEQSKEVMEIVVDQLVQVHSKAGARAIMAKGDPTIYKFMRCVNAKSLARQENNEAEIMRLDDVMAGILSYERIKNCAKWLEDYYHLDWKNITPYNMPKLQPMHAPIAPEWQEQIIKAEHSPIAAQTLRLSGLMHDRVDGFRGSLMLRVA